VALERLPDTEVNNESLVAKHQQLSELRAQHGGLQRKLALLELKKFAAEAEEVINTIPAEHSKRLQGSKDDANRLFEALQEVSDEEFPQVQESYNTVLTGWRGIMDNAQRLGTLSRMGSCQDPSRDAAKNVLFSA